MKFGQKNQDLSLDLNRKINTFAHQWAKTRKSHFQYSWENNIKLQNLPELIKIAEAVFYASKKYNVEVDYITNANTKSKAILFSEGSPNVNLSVVTESFNYQTQGTIINPHFDVWKDVTPDESVIDYFKSIKSRKWKLNWEEKKVDFDHPYGFFPLQQFSPRHREYTIDALKFARDTKTYIVFKSHPCSPSAPAEKIFNGKFKEYISEYSILVGHDSDVDHLVENSDFVIAPDSAILFNALVRGKKAASYKPINISEATSVIETAHQVKDIDVICEDDLKKFLTWYRDYLCIDINKDNYFDRIDERIRLLSQNIPFNKILCP